MPKHNQPHIKTPAFILDSKNDTLQREVHMSPQFAAQRINTGHHSKLLAALLCVPCIALLGFSVCARKKGILQAHLRLEQLLVILERAREWGHPALWHRPKLVHASSDEMLIVTHLQDHSSDTLLLCPQTPLNCPHYTDWNKHLCRLTISTPPWNTSKPWMSASTASRSCNTGISVQNQPRKIQGKRKDNVPWFPHQMVRRLIEKYNVWFLEGDFRECNPTLLTTWSCNCFN